MNAVPENRDAVRTWEAVERAKAALRASEERARLALDAAGMGSFVWHPDEDRGEPDARMLALFGLPPDSPLTLAAALATLIHPADRGRYAAAVARATDPVGGGELREEIRVVHPDGSERWLAVTGRTTFAGEPRRAVRMAGVAADVTDRKRAEGALEAAAAAARFRVALADALRPLADPVAVQAAAARALAEHLRTNRANYAVRDGEDIVVHADYHAGVPSLVGRYRMADYGPGLAAEVAAGRTVVLADLTADDRLTPDARARYAAAAVGASVTVPLVRDGRLSALLSVHQSQPRAWTADELALVEEAAERTWAAVERATAEAALRASEERFRAVAANLPSAAAFVVDHDLRYVLAEGEALRAAGYAPADLEGRTVAEAMPPAVVPEYTARYRRALAGRPFRAEHTAHGRHFLSHGLPLRAADGGVYAALAVSYDITDRKRMEEALREADRRKDEFLAMLGHELRNPLAPLRGVMYMLRRQQLDLPALERAYAMMDRQIEHLNRLVDDLLDVSRITRGQIELRKEPVLLAQVADQAIEMATPVLEGRGHELMLTLPRKALRVEGDATRLTQVVFNLLNNAAKYTDPGGRVWLSAEREGEQAVVRVRDNGAGLPPDLVSRVFDLFTQGERAPDRSQGGLGLGLALVKRLTEMHGGSVEARSDGPGKGSEFVVRLPALPAEVADKAPPPRPLPPQAEFQVDRALVVDDNPDVAESLVMIFEGLAREVRMVHSGAAAVEAARDFRPDVVLCDIGMPGMDGYEVARRLRQEPGLEKVVLAAVSGYGQEEDRRRSKQAGFDRHLVKPIGRATLEELIRAVATAR